MSRITTRFAELRPRHEGALIPFLVAGDPDPARSLAVALAVAEAGADVLELGIPFSDPLADGQVNEQAYLRALGQGVLMPQVLELAGRLRARSQVPLVLMTYYNPVLRYGLEAFASQAAAAGVDGVLVTDLPPEEADPWREQAGRAGLDTVFLLAPTSTPERMARVAGVAGGFVYCVSRTGVTGAREHLPPDLPGMLAQVRRHTELPLAVGFGLASPEQVRAVCRLADGAVVGSALVQVVAQAGADAPRQAARFVRSLKAATHAE